MADEGVFRFIAVREPTAPAQDVTRRVVPSHVGGCGSPLLDEVAEIPAEERTKGRLASVARRFREGPTYTPTAADLPFDIAPLLVWENSNADTLLATLDVGGGVQTAYGSSPHDVVTSEAFRESATRLGDSVLADALAGTTEVGTLDDRIHAIKLLHLIAEATDRPAALQVNEPLGRFVSSPRRPTSRSLSPSPPRLERILTALSG